MDFSTGNYSYGSTAPFDWGTFDLHSAPTTPSPPAAQPPSNTSGKTTPLWQGPDLNLGTSPSNETASVIGTPPSMQREPGDYLTSSGAYWFLITGRFDSLLLIFQNLRQWYEMYAFSGAVLELVSPAWPGNKRAWRLFLKTRAANSGMAIGAKLQLSAMSLEEASTSLIFSDGQIVTLATWK